MTETTLPSDSEIREACLRAIQAIDALLRLLQLNETMKITWDSDRLFASTDPKERAVAARSLRDLAGVLAGFGLGAAQRPSSNELEQILAEARSAIRQLNGYADQLQTK